MDFSSFADSISTILAVATVCAVGIQWYCSIKSLIERNSSGRLIKEGCKRCLRVRTESAVKIQRHWRAYRERQGYLALSNGKGILQLGKFGQMPSTQRKTLNGRDKAVSSNENLLESKSTNSNTKCCSILTRMRKLAVLRKQTMKENRRIIKKNFNHLDSENLKTSSERIAKGFLKEVKEKNRESETPTDADLRKQNFLSSKATIKHIKAAALRKKQATIRLPNRETKDLSKPVSLSDEKKEATFLNDAASSKSKEAEMSKDHSKQPFLFPESLLKHENETKEKRIQHSPKNQGKNAASSTDRLEKTLATGGTKKHLEKEPAISIPRVSEKETMSAIVVQKYWRGYAARRKYSCYFKAFEKYQFGRYAIMSGERRKSLEIERNKIWRIIEPSISNSLKEEIAKSNKRSRELRKLSEERRHSVELKHTSDKAEKARSTRTPMDKNATNLLSTKSEPEANYKAPNEKEVPMHIEITTVSLTQEHNPTLRRTMGSTNLPEMAELFAEERDRDKSIVIARERDISARKIQSWWRGKLVRRRMVSRHKVPTKQ